MSMLLTGVGNNNGSSFPQVGHVYYQQGATSDSPEVQGSWVDCGSDLSVGTSVSYPFAASVDVATGTVGYTFLYYYGPHGGGDFSWQVGYDTEIAASGEYWDGVAWQPCAANDVPLPGVSCVDNVYLGTFDVDAIGFVKIFFQNPTAVITCPAGSIQVASVVFA